MDVIREEPVQYRQNALRKLRDQEDDQKNDEDLCGPVVLRRRHPAGHARAGGDQPTSLLVLLEFPQQRDGEHQQQDTGDDLNLQNFNRRVFEYS